MAFLALYAGLAGWASVLAWRAGPWGRTPLLRLLSFAGAWSLGEVLRGHLLTGFPLEPRQPVRDRLAASGPGPQPGSALTG